MTLSFSWSMSIRVLVGLGDLPLFNADLEDNPPASVRALRSSIGSADALLIASPEYAHGISSVIKNALDWLVSFEGFVAKPIAVVNTSPRARHVSLLRLPAENWQRLRSSGELHCSIQSLRNRDRIRPRRGSGCELQIQVLPEVWLNRFPHRRGSN